MTPSEQLNNMAAITSAQSEIAAYNHDLEYYVTRAILDKYAIAGISVIDGRISCVDVTRATSIYKHYVREVFWQRAADIITDMKTRGYDVRMDMNTYKLVWKGVYNNG